MSAPKIDLKQPLTNADIQAAIEASGYPLEVEVFHELQQEHMNPVLGFRARTGPDTDTKEIDLLAQYSEHVTGNHGFASVALRAYIAAKKLHAPSCFVGVLGEELNEYSQRVARTYLAGGVPTQGIIRGMPDYGVMQLLHGPGGFGEGMQPFLGAPTCAHWAIAQRRTPDGTPWATGDKGFWEDFDVIVRASFHMAREVAEHRLSFSYNASPNPELRFDFPTLLVETPELYLYDPRKRNLTTTSWLVLHRMFEVGAGELVSRSVDVITRSSLSAMIQRFKASAPALGAAMLRNVDALKGAAAKQREWWNTNRVPT